MCGGSSYHRNDELDVAVEELPANVITNDEVENFIFPRLVLPTPSTAYYTEAQAFQRIASDIFEAGQMPAFGGIGSEIWRLRDTDVITPEIRRKMFVRTNGHLFDLGEDVSWEEWGDFAQLMALEAAADDYVG